MAENLDKEIQTQLDAIKEVFPEAFTRSEPDLDLLLEKMEDVLTHLSKEYKSDKALFAWHGKQIARDLLNAPFAGTLYHDEDGNPFYPYGNIFIEGESLEVLKMFVQSYENQVNMVYVDPPSALKHDFVLLDDVNDLLSPYLKLIGETGGTPEMAWPLVFGERHQSWLNFLYPRLMLAHKMLADYGMIFMHASPAEAPYVRFLLDSIFGANKYITTIVWQTEAAQNSVVVDCECIYVYGKHPQEHWPKVIPYLVSLKEPFSNPDNDPRGAWSPISVCNKTFPLLGGLFGRQRGNDARKSPAGKEISPPENHSWLLSEDEMDELTADGRLYWGEENDQIPVMKYYKAEGHQSLIPTNFWAPDEAGSLKDAHTELKEAVPELSDQDLLNDVKPVKLLRRLIQIALPYRDSYYTSKLVVDMFGGTGSMAQAVIEQNAEDHYGRRFFSIQLPQPLSDPKPGLKTFADVARQRIVFAQDSLEHSSQGQTTFYRLGQSNFKHWQNEQYPCQWVSHKEDPEDEIDWEDYQKMPTPEPPPTELKDEWEIDDVLMELILRYGSGFRFSVIDVSHHQDASVFGIISNFGFFLARRTVFLPVVLFFVWFSAEFALRFHLLYSLSGSGSS